MTDRPTVDLAALDALRDEYPGVYYWEDPRWPGALGDALRAAARTADGEDPHLYAVNGQTHCRCVRPADGEGLDVERLMDAEHRFCVQIEGEWALGHDVERHRSQAEFIRAALAADKDSRASVDREEKP